MKKFVAREKEVEKLEKIFDGDGFRFVAVYGRRRVGKSELIKHAISGRDHLYFQATTDMDFNLRRLSALMGSTFYSSSQIAPYTSMAAVFEALVHLIKERNFILVIDEVSYMAQADSSFLSVLQSFVDNDFQQCDLTLVLCSSSTSFIEDNLLGLNSPVYGRSASTIKLLPFSIAETALMLIGWSCDDIARAHALSGGIPYYLSFFASQKSLEEAVEAEFFSPGGRLLVEPRLLLSMSFRSVDLYEGILDLMAHGNNEVSVIASKSGKDKAVVSQVLSKLEEIGVVARRKPIAGVGLSRGWDIVDGSFRFFYRYVFPYESSIEYGAGEGAMRLAMDELDQFTAREMEKAFQRFVLTHYTAPIRTIGNVEFPNRLVHRNEEMDLVAVVSSSTMLFGECKWRRSPVDVDVYEQLVERSHLAYPKLEDRRYCILSRGGFTQALESLAANSGGRLMLLDAEDLIRTR